MFNVFRAEYSRKKILGTILIFSAICLFSYGLSIYLPFYYQTGPVVSSICFIASSIFMVFGLFLYFDIFTNETKEGKKAMFILGLAAILFVSGIVLGTYYYVEYDWENASLRSVPGEEHSRTQVWVVPAINIYPYGELSLYLLLISAILFVVGVIVKFKVSHIF